MERARGARDCRNRERGAPDPRAQERRSRERRSAGAESAGAQERQRERLSAFGEPGWEEWMAFIRDSEGNVVGLASRHAPAT